MTNTVLPHNTLERLFVYRRILQETLSEGKTSIFSRELAEISGATSEQVRRDLMQVGAEGSHRSGYDCLRLLRELNMFFQAETDIRIVVVGVGNLGRAVLTYFMGKRPQLRVLAAFDADPSKTNRVLHGCHCYAIDEMDSVLQDKLVHVGIVAVPDTFAQEVAERLVGCGITSILNFAPIRLRLPAEIQVEDIDMTLQVEKLGFFAKRARQG
jgi:redox-sensing transcriptional repressor